METTVISNFDILSEAERWLVEGHQGILATVIQTWGSSPRQTGSHLVIRQDGHFVGSVSGGCVEGAVMEEALSMMGARKPKTLTFGVADETAWEVGLSCGGTIKILLLPLSSEGIPSLLHSLNKRIKARQLAVTLCDPVTGDISLHHGFDSLKAEPELYQQVLRQVQKSKSALIDLGSSSYFVSVYRPSPRLIMCGAVHITQALAPMAQMAGFDVLVIDPRQAFADPKRFQGQNLVADWPGDALQNNPIDRFTAVIALTHDPKIDDIALKAALQSDCFYIGALGSKKTHAERVARLTEAGLNLSEIDQIEAPIGLDIGAIGPAEIAVAILASLISNWRQKPHLAEDSS